MGTNTLAGLMLILLAGTCSGTFSVPFKKNKKWNWENNWFIWSVVALLIVPWVVAFITVPDLRIVYGSLWQDVLLIAFFGFIWGIGAIMFGKGIHLLGISLSLPIMQGLINSVGTLMPVVLRDPSELLSPIGMKIMGGVLCMIGGIVLFSIAGRKKENRDNIHNRNTPSTFRKGLMVCILAGILGPMINFAFIYGVPVEERAIEYGASPLYATNAVWSIVLSAGFIMNGLECMRLFRKENSWSFYSSHTGKRQYVYAALAGIIWYLSIMFYGMGGNLMGEYGSSVGWAVMQSVAIIAGNIAGILSGEWKGANKNAIYIMISGLVFLIIGILVIAL